MANLPTDVGNEALDSAGVSFTMGDLSEGTRPAQVLLRKYSQARRQLLRAANWDFARKQIPMTLLADATGNTPNVGTNVIQAGFNFEYSYPVDCLKARFVPWSPNIIPASIPGNIVPPNSSAPLTTGQGQVPYLNWRPRPARFLIATDSNYPPPPGTPGDDELPQGVSPATCTVVLTNVQNAQLVYTADTIYPSVWDPLFRAAFVAYLASEVAFPLATDKKFGLQVRNEQIKIAKAKIQEARLVDGNEGTYSSDVRVDWMSARRSGGYNGWGGGSVWGADGGGPGVYGMGYDSCGFADGTAY